MAENRFFRGHKRRGSYDLFSSYSHYLPGIGGMLVLLAMFLIGALLGNLINSSIAALLGRELALKYGTLISYPVMFIPALLYASVRSRLNEHAGAGVPLDSNEGLKGKTALYIFTCILCLKVIFNRSSAGAEQVSSAPSGRSDNCSINEAISSKIE